MTQINSTFNLLTCYPYIRLVYEQTDLITSRDVYKLIRTSTLINKKNKIVRIIHLIVKYETRTKLFKFLFNKFVFNEFL